MSASATQGGHNQLPINCTTTGIQPAQWTSFYAALSSLLRCSDKVRLTTEGKNKRQAAAVIIYVARFILLVTKV